MSVMNFRVELCYIELHRFLFFYRQLGFGAGEPCYDRGVFVFFRGVC